MAGISNQLNSIELLGFATRVDWFPVVFRNETERAWISILALKIISGILVEFHHSISTSSWAGLHVRRLVL